MNGYDTNTGLNDIALIKANEPLDLTTKYSYLQPVCLPTAGVASNSSGCMSAGWGDLEEGGSGPDKLQEVNLPILSTQTCINIYGDEAFKTTLLCAGSMEGGIDTCQGDSGGPLFCPLSNNVWVQEGVVSTGYGCARPGYPGIYTNVRGFLPWIKSTTGIV